MQKYVLSFVFFATALAVSALLYTLLVPYVDKSTVKLVHRSFLVVVSYGLIHFLINEKAELFKKIKLDKSTVGLALIVVVLFAINNLCQLLYANETSLAEPSSVWVVLAILFIGVAYEELLYRGFIQGYINQSTKIKSKPISQGNVFASGLMLFTHLGFYQVMDVVFATTGLLLVLVYSLVAGYFRDKGISIWLLIVFHALINIVHLLFNYEQYVT